MYTDRRSLYDQVGKLRQSVVILYATGDRQGWETQLSADVIDHLVDHLDAIGDVQKISLLLYTCGGQTLAAWSMLNLLRQFCKDLEVIVPRKALSAGTLMCLGANRIVMTKQATLGPIDPSVNNALNPQIPGAGPNARAPVSVEEVRGYLDMAREELATSSADSLAPIFLNLAQQVHPLVLGSTYRAREQIKFLAKQLLENQITDAEKQKNVISFLCSQSGSHDYTISRREAASLGLCIEKPSMELYQLVKQIYDDMSVELALTVPFDPAALFIGTNAGQYKFTRCMLESATGGCHAFQSEGAFSRQQIPTAMGLQTGLQDNRTFEGWRKIV